MTEAVLHDDTKTRWKETYIYDTGDNMSTKCQPWFDTFNDGTLDGWTVDSGTWDAGQRAITKLTEDNINVYDFAYDSRSDSILWEF